MYEHDKIVDSKILREQVALFCLDSFHPISLLANITALLKQYYDRVNWVGFYLAEDRVLYLGPFQGNTACQYIPWGQGVCGKAIKERKTQVVADVTKIKHHIACDAESRSELVVPIIINDEVWGVIDIDSPEVDYFTENDRELIEEICEMIKPKLAI